MIGELINHLIPWFLDSIVTFVSECLEFERALQQHLIY